jgi:hypothetical protein
MSRLEFWGTLGKVSVVEPTLLNAYSSEEDEIWRTGSEESPHGHPWHTSFHASEFPDIEGTTCNRAAVYKLLGPPEEKPITAHLRAWFDLGKNLELDWVRRFAYYGVLLSADQTAGADVQTGFADRAHWLTGSSDAIILPPFWTRGHCTEIKTTSHEKVQAMLQGEPPPKSHGKYLRQTKAYIALAHEAPYTPTVMVCDKSGLMVIPAINRCREGHAGSCQPRIITLEPPVDGTLIYSSREEPMTTVSFYVTYDPELMAAGRARIALMQEAFLRDEIPAHPREQEKSKWSVAPCEYCSLKKFVCKPDYTKKITKLSDSHLASFGRKIRPGFDIEERRQAVITRWQPMEAEAA